jgi:hypothetical protein
MSTTRRPLRSPRRRTPNRQPSGATPATGMPTTVSAGAAADVVAFVAPARSATVHGLARRHGYHTEAQRAKLRESVQRYVNAGYLRLDEADANLAMLGLGPLNGPGTVTFRLRVAITVVHEDDETDAAMLRCALDEVRLHWSQLAGLLGEIHVSRPRPHPGSGRHRARARADVFVRVTVRACPTEDDLVPVATGLLYDDLKLLREHVDIIDAPTVFDTATSRDTTFDSDPYDSDRDGDGDQGAEGDADGDSSSDRFLDPFDDDSGRAEDDWAYPDSGRPSHTDLDADLDADVDVESDTDLPRLRRARRTFAGEWDDEVFETVHNHLGVR